MNPLRKIKGLPLPFDPYGYSAKQQKREGFTLIEILVVVGIMSLFLTMSMFQLRSFQQGSHLQNTTQETAAALRLAQSRTLASQDNSQYGVYFDITTTPHQYTLFQGSSYATRDIAKDEVTLINKEIEISAIDLEGGNEVVFLRLSGQASVEGSVTFRQTEDPTRTATVTVLASGVIEEDSAVVPSDTSRVKDSRHVHVSYQGRDIVTSTESVGLVFPDTTFSFAIADNMSGGQIFWEGDVESEGETQHLKIHTHILNDPVQGTRFSLHRDRSKNTKSVTIELSGDITGNLISYDAGGATTQGTSIYAQTPELQ